MGGNWRNRGVIGYQIGRKRDKIRNKFIFKNYCPPFKWKRPVTHTHTLTHTQTHAHTSVHTHTHTHNTVHTHPYTHTSLFHSNSPSFSLSLSLSFSLSQSVRLICWNKFKFNSNCTCSASKYLGITEVTHESFCYLIYRISNVKWELRQPTFQEKAFDTYFMYQSDSDASGPSGLRIGPCAHTVNANRDAVVLWWQTCKRLMCRAHAKSMGLISTAN